MDERARLAAKLRRIDALIAGGATEGERYAALQARHRVLERLRRLQPVDPAVEFKLTMPDEWSKRLLMALLRRHGLRPYRYSRQRRTTVMVSAPRRMMARSIWPQFQRLSRMLDASLHEATQRVIRQAMSSDRA
jgi:hypothetical protein